MKGIGGIGNFSVLMMNEPFQGGVAIEHVSDDAPTELGLLF